MLPIAGNRREGGATSGPIPLGAGRNMEHETIYIYISLSLSLSLSYAYAHIQIYISSYPPCNALRPLRLGGATREEFPGKSSSTGY